MGMMKIEVTPDGDILIDGQIAGRTNNPEEVRRHLFRKLSRSDEGRPGHS